MDGGALDIYVRAALYAWLAPFHVTPRADLEPALHAAARYRGGAHDFRPLYRGYAAFGIIVR